MKTVNSIVFMFVCLLLPLGAGAQDTHWTVDPYAYKYDMTAYVSLTVNGSQETNYDDFEVAAFCGDECRGVATFMKAGSGSNAKTYGYLRIRSNQQEGETITFKVYHKIEKLTTDIGDTSVTFMSQDVAGMPSSPLLLQARFSMKGDVNDDGYRNHADMSLLISLASGKTTGEAARARADINGDNKIDIADIISFIHL